MSTEPVGEMPYQDLLHVTECFADHVRLIHWDGQTVRIEFAVSRPYVTGAHSASVTIRPAARLVLTLSALTSLHEQLSGLVAELQRGGVLKRLSPAPVLQQ